MPNPMYDPDDKAAVVRGLAELFARIPALDGMTLEHGYEGPNGFVPAGAGPANGCESVRFTVRTSSADIQYVRSIAGDSQIAVVHDVARALAEIMF